MRNINIVAIHCTATRPNQIAGVDVVRAWHLAKGWSDIGYHFLIRRDGCVEVGRPIKRAGAHVYGHNKESVGVSWEGGLSEAGDPADNRTDKQKHALECLLRDLVCEYPTIKEIKGHRDFSPDLDGDGVIERFEWLKACPCFDAIPEYKHLLTEDN